MFAADLSLTAVIIAQWFISSATEKITENLSSVLIVAFFGNLLKPREKHAHLTDVTNVPGNTEQASRRGREGLLCALTAAIRGFFGNAKERILSMVDVSLVVFGIGLLFQISAR